jgi:hypothetical protein
MRYFLFFSISLLLITGTVYAQNQCSGKGVMGGLDYAIHDCAVAFYDSGNSVTIWFSETPITADERQKFEFNSYADDFVKEASGKRRSMITLGFCPGGGKPTPDPQAVKTLEIDFFHSSGPLPALQDQWVLDFPKDKDLKFEKLGGDLKLGGTLNGRITGTLKSNGKPFSVAIDFQMKLPEKGAAAGPGCS